MLTKPTRCQAKKLREILANGVAIAKPQRGMNEEELRRGKSSPKLARRRWSDGKLAEKDPIPPSNVLERKRTGGVEDEEVEQRRESAPA
jgi:hypothetical protein